MSLLAVHYIRYIVCKGRLRNLRADSSKIGLYCVTIPGQQRFASSYGSKGFCRMWLLNADICGRKCSETMTASHVVLYGVKRSTAANEAHLLECCRNMGHFVCGAERVKRYVNVHLQCMVSNLKTTNKMSTLPSLAKILRTFMPVLSVFINLLCTAL